MYLFGTTLIVMGISFGLLASIAYAFVIRGNRAALTYARFGVTSTTLTVIALWLLLIALFVARRFDIAYVNNYSSNDLSFFFTVAASWAGQPGSFLIWALCGVLIGALLIGRTRHFEPYVLVTFMAIQAMLLVFVLILNPFAPMIDTATGLASTPTDGRGLNPLLHNFWMIIHPPILFLGYALTTVPFVFALAALMRHDYDTWVARALPWTIAAWAALGAALFLGGYWAYETLGWGGYWGWDPVENSSLVPWIITTALLHGMLVQRTHGGLRRSNLALAIINYVLVFYATFLTRSGVYANFSVHSFVAEGIYETLVGFLLLLTVGGLGFFFLRWRDIPTDKLSDRFFSRDSFFVLGIIALVVLATIISFGTSMPVISAIPGIGAWLQTTLGSVFDLNDGTAAGGTPFTDGRFALAQSFFQRVSPPLGVVVVVLLTIGPLLGWRDTNLRHLLKMLIWPAVAGVIALCSALFFTVRDPLSLAYVGFGTFAIGTNFAMLLRIMRSGWLRIGGYFAHLGISIMLIGMVGSSAYAAPEERLAMATGQTVGIYGYDFTFNSWKQTPDGKGVIDLTVKNGNDTFSAQPQLYFNQTMGSTMQTPAVKSYLWQDLYVSPADYIPEADPARPVMGISDTVKMGPYELTFTGFDVDMNAMMTGQAKPEFGAKLKVIYQGQASIVIPKIDFSTAVSNTAEGFLDIPATLPGGHKITLSSFDLERRLVLLSAEGLGLPVQPARAVITVSTKPLVLLVWVGISIGVLGGLIALLRRYLESDAQLRGVPVQLPRWSPFASRKPSPSGD